MRGEDYISEVRSEARKLWDSIHELKALQAEWNALDYATTLADGSGANEGYSKTAVGSVVFDTTDAMLTTLSSGHATNIANLL